MNYGFTLIELLTVIAIIGILSALVFTGVNSARKAAYRAANTANLKELMQAWMLHAADNKGFFPLGLTWGAVDRPIENAPPLQRLEYRHWWRWYGGVATYLPTVAPDENEQYAPYNAPPAPSWNTVYRGYFCPLYFGTLKEVAKKRSISVGYHFNRHIGFYKRIRPDMLQSPSRTPILFAYFNPANSDDPMRQYFCAPDSDTNDFMSGATDTLDGGNAFAFADGHVQWVPKQGTAQAYLDLMQWLP